MATGKVNIGRMFNNGDNTSIDFDVDTLNIGGTIELTNDEFGKAIAESGYISLGDYILKKLEHQLNDLINDSLTTTSTIAPTTQAPETTTTTKGGAD